MKKLITIGLSFIWITAVVFSACTKDRIPVPQQSVQSGKSFKEPGGVAPVYIYGILKGTLFPAPYSAELKIYDNKEFSLGVIVPENGVFKVNTLPAGEYDMLISYTVQRGDNFYTLYHEITGISMEDGEVTDLGVIYLPWTY